MITVAIVAILAAVAYPSYVDHVRRSRIAEATGLLSMTRVRLEQFYQDNRHYGATATACGVAMPAADQFTISCNWGGVGSGWGGGAWGGALRTADQFTFSCDWGAGATNQTFLLTATGNAGLMNGFTYTVDDANAQRTTAFPGASGLPASCWMQRQGDTC